jgi:hypothetical protein
MANLSEYHYVFKKWNIKVPCGIFEPNFRLMDIPGKSLGFKINFKGTNDIDAVNYHHTLITTRRARYVIIVTKSRYFNPTSIDLK